MSTLQVSRTTGLTRTAKIATAGVLGAAAALAGAAGTASAATYTPGDFNPALSVVYRGYFGNCSIETGPIVDPYGTSHGFAVIGGGRINCTTRHTFTAVTREYWSATGVGASFYSQSANSTTYTNSFGFGSRTLETGRVCGTGYWFTRVTVAASGYASLYFDSPVKAVTAAGQSSSVC